MVQAIADKMADSNHPNLAYLLKQRPLNHHSPLLAVAVQYFFRRQLLAKEWLFEELTLAKLDDFSERQLTVMEAMAKIMTEHRHRFKELTGQVLATLGAAEQPASAVGGHREGHVDLERRPEPAQGANQPTAAAPLNESKSIPSIHCRCRLCGARVKAPHRLLGQIRPCPKCQRDLPIHEELPEDQGPILLPLQFGLDAAEECAGPSMAK